MRIIALLILMCSSIYSQTEGKLDANNIRSWVWGTGVFDQHVGPGFEWPKGSGHFAIYTAGLTIGTFINGQIRFASATYRGEYEPGYCINAIGYTNGNFKIYKVTRGDNENTNPDWANWGLMVPYGAPFKDVNNNGTYQPAIDIPGVKNAAQTIFICLTDANPGNHNISEFGGGTPPVFAEVHLTAWCYDNPGFENMQFLKWVVINKHLSAWDSTIISIVANPDLGNPNDDYVGCDSANNLGFCYNSDNNDEGGYGLNPPVVGMMFLNCSGANSKLSSFVPLGSGYSNEPSCEPGPGNVWGAYNYLKGLKNDGTPWVNIITNRVTKFCYSGDLEAGNGWTEFSGRIENCGGSLSGPHVIPSPPGDKWFAMSYKPPNQKIYPGDSQVVMMAQFIARGSSYLNTFTEFKRERDKVKILCQNGFVIGIRPISTEIPSKYNLYQNYPNPFNPVTKIRFQIPLLRGVDATGGRGVSTQLVIYDAIGREISTLVNEKLQPGVYSVDWDGTNYPNGVYFYKLVVRGATPLQSENFSETRKMVLVK